jgi:hypothetical protein
MSWFNPAYGSLTNILANEVLDLFTITNGANYLKVFAIPVTPWASITVSGAYIVVPNGGSPYTVTMTADQLRLIANAITHHLSTGSVNSTVNGVAVVTDGGTGGVDVTVAAVSYTYLLTNDQARQLAAALNHYCTTNP